MEICVKVGSGCGSECVHLFIVLFVDVSIGIEVMYCVVSSRLLDSVLISFWILVMLLFYVISCFVDLCCIKFSYNLRRLILCWDFVYCVVLHRFDASHTT